METPIGEEDEATVDLTYALGELREIRAEMRASAERAARLEKRLRDMQGRHERT